MQTQPQPICPMSDRATAGRAPSRRRAAGAALCLLGLALVAGCRPPASAPPPGELGAAPDFSLTALDGTTVTLSSLRGRVVLLDFWASWCPPCRAGLPHIEAIHRDYAARGLAVYGINNEDPALARAFVQANRFTFPTLSDPDSAVMGAYGVEGLPTTVLIDREGVVRYRFVGLTPEAQMRDALRQLGL